MPLEVANFIPELVETNPDGTDLASTLDNHDRVIKTAVKGSFPNFVGTTGSPAFVSKTEAQLNDTVEASADNSFTGNNDINGNPIAVQRITERVVPGNTTVLQTDEQNVIRYEGGGTEAITFDQLIAGTVGTIKNVGTGTLQLTPGTIGTLRWLDGSGNPPTGQRNMVEGSVIEYHYVSPTVVEIWGTGLS